MTPTLLNDYPKKLYLGSNADNGGIYMSRPSWDCDWYWGFGYIGNRNLHTHLNCLGKSNLYDNLKNYFNQEFIIKEDKDIWQFAEVVMTIYQLRKTAELFHRGGSHYTTNPQQQLLINPEWEQHINCVLIPQQIDAMYQILAKYSHD